MITRDQAIDPATTELHFSEWHNSNGQCQRLRRNGQTQTWKTRPEDFIFKGKWGLHDYHHVTPETAYLFHTPEECPLNVSETPGLNHLADIKASDILSVLVPSVFTADTFTGKVRVSVEYV